MQQNILPKKQAKKHRKIKIYLGILILICISADIYLINKAFFVKKPLFISPISLVELSKNSSFESKLKKSKVDYTDFKTTGNLYQFSVKGEGKVTMSSSKNIDEQLSSLQVIIRNLKIKGIRFKSLDFRYDKPVIVQYD